jgi:hypothetical protein
MRTRTLATALAFSCAPAALVAQAPAAAAAKALEPVTYTRQVAPILQQKCQVCHQPNSIALVQLERGYMIEPKPIIRERYVLARDPKDPEHVTEAALFYDHIKMWAERLEAEFVILSDMSDVPLDMIKKKMGRTFEKHITYVRV